MMNLPLLFRFREPLATLPSLVVLAVLIIAGVQKATELKRKEDPQPVRIALMELPCGSGFCHCQPRDGSWAYAAGARKQISSRVLILSI